MFTFDTLGPPSVPGLISVTASRSEAPEEPQGSSEDDAYRGPSESALIQTSARERSRVGLHQFATWTE